MTRDEMINKLSTVKFKFIDPSSDWEDIGFTERPIWVNSNGYGYIMCDEPFHLWEGEGIGKTALDNIKTKLLERTISAEDIEGTSLVDMLEEMYWGEFNLEEDDLIDALSFLLTLDPEPIKGLYCMDTFDGIQFFSTEEDFLEACERDWCDYKWQELDDDILANWIYRLFD